MFGCSHGVVEVLSAKSKSLPDPNGPLSSAVKPQAIESANRKVSALLATDSSTKDDGSGPSRGPYMKFSPEQKAQIARYAMESGNKRAIWRYSNDWGIDLKESTVRSWKSKYKDEVRKRKPTEPLPIKALPNYKQGRPLLLGEKLDTAVKAYVENIRKLGGVVNTAIVLGGAEAIIANKDRSLVDTLAPGKDWAKSLLTRMGFVKRKATTKAKVPVKDFEAIKTTFLNEVFTTVIMEDIPQELIVNWDHTALHYVPVSSWTMEKKGSTRVPVAGIDDKRQVTTILACSMTGEFLPPQVIYQGKTTRSLPSYKLPADWDVTYTPNHWANEDTSLQYLQKIILPFMKQKREELGFSADRPALVLFDHFKGQVTKQCLQFLEDHHIHHVLIPENCTDRLQPLDVAVNKPVKDFMKAKFQKWYAEQVASQLKEDKDTHPVDMRLSIMKPLSAQWLLSMFDHFKKHPEIVLHGFHASGINDCLKGH